MQHTEISEFGNILIFIIGGILFISLVLFVGRLIRPRRPNEEKNATYESGEEAVGNAWAAFNPRFYVIALVFLLFEVELVFLFPWATVFGRAELIEATNGIWGKFAIAEMLMFIFILALGLAYAWKKGFLNWQNTPTIGKVKGLSIKNDLYKKVNEKYSPSKNISL